MIITNDHHPEYRRTSLDSNRTIWSRIHVARLCLLGVFSSPLRPIPGSSLMTLMAIITMTLMAIITMTASNQLISINRPTIPRISPRCRQGKEYWQVISGENLTDFIFDY